MPSQSRPASRSSYRPSSLPWSLSKGLPLVAPRDSQRCQLKDILGPVR